MQLAQLMYEAVKRTGKTIEELEHEYERRLWSAERLRWDLLRKTQPDWHQLYAEYGNDVRIDGAMKRIISAMKKRSLEGLIG